ncbi:MAG: rod shape determining protein RodA [Parcubacteria group bacterium Licking1014_17]|nr:MAG: rod shape determining protein RodA [Parcubacteria group bacterium Licking1014_17]
MSLEAGDYVITVRQLIFIATGLAVMFLVAFLDYRVFKNSSLVALLPYLISVLLLIIVFAFKEIRGASSWIKIGVFRLEPSEFAKVSLIILLAKYFSLKHIEISRIRHIFISGIYAVVPATLAFFQPDLGSALVMIAIWLGMLMFSGVRKSHLAAIFIVGIVISTLGWFFLLKPYQRTRITTFINPYVDPRGTGYSTIQSRITFGSGKILGILGARKEERPPTSIPEPFTDFTFAAFAQKFGFVGVVVLLGAFFLLIQRIGNIGGQASNNFAKLFSLGLITMIFTHLFINAGMNMGIMPITGIPLTFLSHGGSHLIAVMAGIGLIQSIKLHG